MTDGPSQPGPRGHGWNEGRVLLEAALVLVAGLVLALAANQISPHGLKLTRDYFPQMTNPVAAAPVLKTSAPVALPGTNSASRTNTNIVVEKLRQQGLAIVDREQAVRLYQDPQYAQELVIFVDARGDADYQAGHVPGAYQLDHFHPEKYLPTALPACQMANRIVVYCNGGDCEDSRFTAVTLHQAAGLPLDKLSVYVGGFADWSTNGLPVELGVRKSGNLWEVKK